MEHPAHGVYAAVTTPFDAHGATNAEAFIAHAKQLLEHGCDGLAVFGTTGEGNSLTVDERVRLLEALVGAGIPPKSIMPGVGACALPDLVRLTKAALALGIVDVLALPPFYYKVATDDGLFDAYAWAIDAIGDGRLHMYLYHIPQVSGVAITHGLVEKLLGAYPDAIAGIKDSTRDWTSIEGWTKFPNFRVFSGSEQLLLPTLRAGGVGTICAMANVQSADIATLYAKRESAEADALQSSLAPLASLVGRFPVIAALKALTARTFGDESWNFMRAPLSMMSVEQRSALYAEVDALNVPA